MRQKVGKWFNIFVASIAGILIVSFFGILNTKNQQKQSDIIEKNTDLSFYISQKVGGDYISLTNISTGDMKNIFYYVSYFEGKYSTGEIENIERGKTIDIKLERKPKNIFVNSLKIENHPYLAKNYDQLLLNILQ